MLYIARRLQDGKEKTYLTDDRSTADKLSRGSPETVKEINILDVMAYVGAEAPMTLTRHPTFDRAYEPGDLEKVMSFITEARKVGKLPEFGAEKLAWDERLKKNMVELDRKFSERKQKR